MKKLTLYRSLVFLLVFLLLAGFPDGGGFAVAATAASAPVYAELSMPREESPVPEEVSIVMEEETVAAEEDSLMPEEELPLPEEEPIASEEESLASDEESFVPEEAISILEQEIPTPTGEADSTEQQMQKAIALLAAYADQVFFTDDERISVNTAIEFLLAQDANYSAEQICAWDALYTRANDITVTAPEGVTISGAALSAPAEYAQGAQVELMLQPAPMTDLLIPNEYGGAPKVALDISMQNTLFVSTAATLPPDLCETEQDGAQTADAITFPAAPKVPVTITLPVPDALKGNPGIVVLHYKKGSDTPEIIIPSADADGEWLTFSTDSFSTFVITGESGTAPSYTIILPSSVDFGKLRPQDGEKTITFTLHAVISGLTEGSGINVSVAPQGEESFTLRNAAGNETISYTVSYQDINLTQAGEICFFDTDVDTEQEGTGRVITLQADTSGIKKSGAYSGTMIFTAAYEAAP